MRSRKPSTSRPARRRLGVRPPETTTTTETASPRALRIIGAVAANVTLLTALLYFFGLLDTQVFFGYFRVHYTLLDQSTAEILGRGVDGLQLPLAGIAAAGLVLTGLVRVLRTRLPERYWARLLRIGTPLATVAGLTLVGVVVPVALNPAPFREYAGLPGLGLALGVLLLVLSWRRWTRPPGAGLAVTERVVTYLLVAFGLFWAAGDYSQQVGTRRAWETAVGIPTLPAAVLYSAQSLSLSGGGVTQVQCGQVETAYKYRYTGLKLLLQSGGQYVFVPANWRPSSGTSLVIPKSNALRLEFLPPRTTPPSTC